MKKIINKAENIVAEMLDGIVQTNSQVIKIPDFQVIRVKDFDPKKVALISGGGSGHEPAHAGYVGAGMLDAAVCGEIFTSPTPDQIKAAIDSLNSQKGTLLIVKNYTGDNLNFQIAQQLAKGEDKQVNMVIVNDDVAVEDSTWTTGRRGIAGTIFVHKIAGALAAQGANLQDVTTMAQQVIANVRSFGISLNSIIIPATKKASFRLDDEMIEFGLGIHGEPGIKQGTIKPAKVLVAEMLELILTDLDYTTHPVALMINGLGGTPEMELFIAAHEALEYLKAKEIQIVASHVGNFMTSLEMQGISISLLRLVDKQMQTLLQATTEVKAWK